LEVGKKKTQNRRTKFLSYILHAISAEFVDVDRFAVPSPYVLFRSVVILFDVHRSFV